VARASVTEGETTKGGLRDRATDSPPYDKSHKKGRITNQALPVGLNNFYKHKTIPIFDRSVWSFSFA
jgi:hypothetical protein